MTDQAPAPMTPSQLIPGELGIDDVVRFLRKSWRSALLGAAIASGGAAAFAFNQPRTWESTASLLVSPPIISGDFKAGSVPGDGQQSTFVTQIKPPTFTVLSFQRLLESAAVIDETRSQLIAKGVIPANAHIEVGKDLEARIFTAKRDESSIQAPLIECHGRGPTPAQAVTITETWVTTALDRARELTASCTAPSYQLIEKKYAENTARLQKLEGERDALSAQFQRQRSDLEKRWGETLQTCTLEGDRLVVAYQNETDQKLTDVRLANKLPGIQARIDALTRTLADLNLTSGKDRTNTTSLESVPPEKIGEHSQAIAEQLTVLQNQFLTGDLAVRKLERERANGLNELNRQQTLRLAQLNAQQQQEIDDAKRSETIKIAQFDRDISPLKDLDKTLSASYGQIQIAKAQQATSDIQLAAPAVQPTEPLPRGASKVVAIASLFGLFAGLGLALLRSIIRRLDAQGG